MPAESFPNPEELRYLKATVASLDVEIGAYSAAQQTKEQMRIRSDGMPDSLKRWLRKKVEMDDKRKALIDRKSEMVARIIQIKPRVHQEAIAPPRQGESASAEHKREARQATLSDTMIQLVQEAQQSNRLLTQILDQLRNQTSNDAPSTPSRT